MPGDGPWSPPVLHVMGCTASQRGGQHDRLAVQGGPRVEAVEASLFSETPAASLEGFFRPRGWYRAPGVERVAVGSIGSTILLV